MTGKVVIIGGGIAGISAKLRNMNSKLIDRNPFLTMSPRIIGILQGKSLDFPNIDRKLDYTGNVNSIDFNNKTIDINGKNINYDKVIIATGHSQRFDFIKGSKYVHGFSDIKDAQYLRDHIEYGNKIVIIGGGYLGVELAGALQSNNITILEAGKQILSGLPEKFSELATELLAKKGVNIELETPVVEVKKNCVISGSKSIDSDITIFAGGFTGNLPSMDRELKTKNGRIAVNSLLQSVDNPDVYAAGDSMFIEEGGFIPMSAIIARSSGITAMENAMGYKHHFKPNNFANIIRIGNQYFGTVGNRFIHGNIAHIIKDAAIALSINHAKEV
jgi:NADH dehydrogenase